MQTVLALMMPSLFLLYVLPAVFYSLHCMQAFVPKLEVNVWLLRVFVVARLH